MSPELAEEENVVYADVWSLEGSEWNHVQQITVNYWYFSFCGNEFERKVIPAGY